MKILSLIFVLIAIVIIGNGFKITLIEKYKHLESMFQKCVDDYKISEDEYYKISDEKQGATTQEGKCFLYCIFEGEYKCFSNGEYDESKVIEYIKDNVQINSTVIKEVYIEIVKKCKSSVTSSDKCEVANELYKCVSVSTGDKELINEKNN